MKQLKYLLLCVLIFSACTNSGTLTATRLVVTPPGGTLPPPDVNITQAPDAISAMNSYLTAWQNSDYTTLYDLINGVSKDAYTSEGFSKIYADTAYSLTLQSLEFSILSSLTNPASAQIAYRVVFHTSLFGDLSRDMQTTLNLENGSWKVAWESGLILPELKGGNTLSLDVKFPPRGNIYDRYGKLIATNTNAVALAVIPGQINPDQEGDVIYYLAKLTGLEQATVRGMIAEASADWYVAIGETTADQINDVYDTLSGFNGLVMSDYTGRFYDNNGIAPQVIGYLLSIPEEQVDAFKRQGYAGDEKVGMAGLEKWGERFLAGKPTASLYVVAPDGKIISRITQADPVAQQDIYTTLDKDLQLAAQKAILGFTGAIVVMERNTGRILAMVSSPSIDPNYFDPNNRNNAVLGDMLNDGEQRILNRAAQSSYPPGSVFKIITMAAALESGLFTAESTYLCGYEFTEIPGVTLEDWTKAKGVDPSGLLTLPEGLMRSCNPYFNHIGLTLFREKGANYLANIAYGFGLGSATGIEQVAEDTGQVTTPEDDGAAAQQGFGQGALLVTPLQVVDYVAAIGNGGTLWRPQIIEKIMSSSDEISFSFEPEIRGILPVSAANLEIIKNAMKEVIRNTRGTAYQRFLGINIPLFGKTGTATNSTDTSHAWFVGFTDRGTIEKSDIAMAVFLEFGGEGSEKAAPVFRRVLEAYYGYTLSLYRWESSYYVTRTPTPTATPEY